MGALSAPPVPAAWDYYRIYPGAALFHPNRAGLFGGPALGGGAASSFAGAVGTEGGVPGRAAHGHSQALYAACAAAFLCYLAAADGYDIRTRAGVAGSQRCECLYTHVLNKGAHAACAVAAADSGACFFGYLLVMQQESTSLVGASPGFYPQSGQAA